ncbi:putative conserved membrane protein [Synechococcus sp. MEDNS5]|uniref:hypothetical protein n=1 Tax=Synechococcus sp. MEDNS5 TaxID=1442554 RepID=UPI000B6A1FD4|nr:hypothetical protein [Synechococcus sp. MEDNS5]OUX75001.1 MAG: hypothetical protein CBC50_00100 [Synechococcus sp. TMED90]QNJ07475.1 putative conserved membrane protein [Synechococcus sp. MEDNS5]
MNKAGWLGSLWGGALLLSAALRFWGARHPEPLEVRSGPALVLVLAPAVLITLWLLWSSRGSGESEQSDTDQESA